MKLTFLQEEALCSLDLLHFSYQGSYEDFAPVGFLLSPLVVQHQVSKQLE
jgi:hypothetical protein